MLYRRASENCAFEYQQNKKKQLHFSAYLADNENFVDCERIKEFQFENFSTGKELSINTLTEEVKLMADGNGENANPRTVICQK